MNSIGTIRSTLLLLLLTLILAAADESVDTQDESKAEKGKKKDGYIWTVPAPVDPIKVGHIREVELVPGMKHHMRTLAMDPPLFEIPGFLTSKECDRLIKAAKDEGLESSPVMDDPDTISSKTTYQTFDEWDDDSDGFISAKELMNLRGKNDLYFTEEDIHVMFKELQMDKNGDGQIDFDEFQETTVRRIKKYFNYVRRKIPRLRSRNSNQAWIWHDDPYDVKVENLHQRLHKLTNLPLSVLKTSEPLQVVRYRPKGHYHCHHDSDEMEEDKPCCVYGNTDNCRLCRYITVLYFLNEPLEGGETAFPVADNVTFDEQAWGEESSKLCNLAKHCHDANIYVKPKKGKAIMWYNHWKDKETGWVGEMITRSYHGGCDVIRGVKWIANNWLNVIAWPGSWMVKNGWKKTLPRVMSDQFEVHKNEEVAKMAKESDDQDEEDAKEGSSAGEEDEEDEEKDDEKEGGDEEEDDKEEDDKEDDKEEDDKEDDSKEEVDKKHGEGDEEEEEDEDINLLSDNEEKANSRWEGEDIGPPKDKGEEDGAEELQNVDVDEDEPHVDDTDSLHTLGDDYEELGDSYQPVDDSDQVTIRRYKDEL